MRNIAHGHVFRVRDPDTILIVNGTLPRRLIPSDLILCINPFQCFKKLILLHDAEEGTKGSCDLSFTVSSIGDAITVGKITPEQVSWLQHANTIDDVFPQLAEIEKIIQSTGDGFNIEGAL